MRIHATLAPAVSEILPSKLPFPHYFADKCEEAFSTVMGWFKGSLTFVAECNWTIFHTFFRDVYHKPQEIDFCLSPLT